MSVYTKPGKQSSDTISCQNDSLRLPYLLFSLPICQAIDQPLIYIEAILLSKRGLGEFRIGLRRLHLTQNGTDCTGSIFVPPADAQQSCTGLLEQSVSDSCRAV